MAKPDTSAAGKPLILFAGGGSAGHVTPNLAIMDTLTATGKVRLQYIGTPNGIERGMIERTGVPYIAVPSGKLRRYFSWQNFIDPFKLAAGILLAIVHALRLRPKVMFSKGGFASVPAVVGAWAARVPVIIHESDRSPGLANKICARFATRICVSFDDCAFLQTDAGRTVLTGSPVREDIFTGDKARGLMRAGLDGSKPVLMVVGGSLGAQSINATVRDGLDDLLARFDVIHITGRGHIDERLSDRKGYVQLDFVQDGFNDLMQAADIVISRAGANALAELAALHKPHVLIPLPTAGSRGDQIENAESYAARGASVILRDEDLTAARLITALDDVQARKDELVRAMQSMTCDRGGAAAIEQITGLLARSG